MLKQDILNIKHAFLSRRPGQTFKVCSAFVLFLFVLGASVSASAQDIPDPVMQKAIEENQKFFEDVLNEYGAEADRAMQEEAEAQSDAVYRAAGSSAQTTSRSAGNSGMRTNRSAGSGTSMMLGSGEGSNLPDNAIVNYKEGALKEDPLHGVELPQRVFNNIDGRR